MNHYHFPPVPGANRNRSNEPASDDKEESSPEADALNDISVDLEEIKGYVIVQTNHLETIAKSLESMVNLFTELSKLVPR